MKILDRNDQGPMHFVLRSKVFKIMHVGWFLMAS
jgi:hypothetical protein